MYTLQQRYEMWFTYVHVLIGANCPGTSGTVTELLVTSLVPHGSLPCPGYSAVYLIYGRNYRRRSGNEAAKWRRKELIRRRSEFQAIHRSSTFAQCVLCSSDFSISHGGRRDITTHGSGERQQKKATLTSKLVSTYFSQHNDLL